MGGKRNPPTKEQLAELQALQENIHAVGSNYNRVLPFFARYLISYFGLLTNKSATYFIYQLLEKTISRLPLNHLEEVLPAELLSFAKETGEDYYPIFLIVLALVGYVKLSERLVDTPLHQLANYLRPSCRWQAPASLFLDPHDTSTSQQQLIEAIRELKEFRCRLERGNSFFAQTIFKANNFIIIAGFVGAAYNYGVRTILQRPSVSFTGFVEMAASSFNTYFKLKNTTSISKEQAKKLYQQLNLITQNYYSDKSKKQTIDWEDYEVVGNSVMFGLQAEKSSIFYLTNKKTQEIRMQDLIESLGIKFKELLHMQVLAASKQAIFIACQSILLDTDISSIQHYLNARFIAYQKSLLAIKEFTYIIDPIMTRPWFTVHLPKNEQGLPDYIFILDVLNTEEEIIANLIIVLQKLYGDTRVKRDEDSIIISGCAICENEQLINENRQSLIALNKDIVMRQPKKEKEDNEEEDNDSKDNEENKEDDGLQSNSFMSVSNPNEKSRKRNFNPASFFNNSIKEDDIIRWPEIGRQYNLDDPKDPNNNHVYELWGKRIIAQTKFIFSSLTKKTVEKATGNGTLHGSFEKNTANAHVVGPVNQQGFVESKMMFTDKTGQTQQASYKNKILKANGEGDYRAPAVLVSVTLFKTKADKAPKVRKLYEVFDQVEDHKSLQRKGMY